MKRKTLRVEDMTDEQINFMVADYVYGEGAKLADAQAQLLAEYGALRYCSNSLLAWPIILEHKISLVYDFDGWGKWTAGEYFMDGDDAKAEFRIEATHENPLRAAMIVFLKLMEATE